MTSEPKSSTVCPRCQTRYLLSAALVGRRTVCRICGLNFHLLPPPEAASTRPASWPFSHPTALKEGPPAEAPEFTSRLDLRPGQLILDTYEILSFLGQGGMSQVFRVRHRDWGIDLALKVPRLELMKKGLSLEFVREATLWSSLGLHPNIATCYYVRSILGAPAIFAQYAEGGSLNHWIRTSEGYWGRLYQGTVEDVLDRILNIAIQAAWGLAYAHGEKLLHLDVKPHNFLLAEDGRVLVTDFGVSRALNQSSVGTEKSLPATRNKGDGLSSSTATVRTDFKLPPSSGTPEYYSPERTARQDPTVGDDLWSWALSVLEMFWGGRYWEVGSVAGDTLKAQRLSGDIALKAPAPLPGLVADFLENCLDPNPERRPRSLEQGARALSKIYEQVLNRPFTRAFPQGGRDTPASLNNQAVSFLDLGLNREAGELFRRALAGEPCHLESVFNQGLFQWRQGLISDDTLLDHLSGLSGNVKSEVELGLMTAQVHLERGDPTTAEESLSDQGAGELARETVNLKNLISQLRFSGRRSLKAQGPFSSAIVGLTASSDGRRLLAAFEDQTVRIYQSGKLEVLGEFSSGLDFAGAALLKKGPAIVAGYLKNEPEVVSLRFFNLETGERQLEIKTDFQSLAGLAALPEAGPRGYLALAGLGEAGFLQLLDLANGLPGPSLLSSKVPLNGLAASVSSRFLGAYNKDSLYIWNIETGELQASLPSSGSGWSGLAVNDDGLVLASEGKDIRFYENLSNEPRKLLGQRGHVSFLSFLEGQLIALTAGHDGRLRLWDLRRGRCLFTFQGHEAPVEMAQILNNGGTAVSYGEDGYLRHWNLSGPVRRPPAPYRLAKAALPEASPELKLETGQADSALFQNSRLAELAEIAAETTPGPADLQAALALVNQEPALLSRPLTAELTALKKRLYSYYPHSELVDHKALLHDDTPGPFRAGALNGQWSAQSRGQDLSLRALKPGDGVEPEGLVFELSEEISNLTFSPNGQMLAVSGQEGGLWLFQPSSPDPRSWQTRWDSPVTKIAFMNQSEPGADHLLTLSEQGRLASWVLTRENKPPKAPAAGLKLTEDLNQHLAATSSQGLIMAAGTDSGNQSAAALISWPFRSKNIKKWALPSSPSTLELSPWGELTALGLTNGVILLSRLENPAEVIMELEHSSEASVTAIAFSPDSHFLASAYSDGLVMVWSLRDGQVYLLDNSNSDSALISLSFSPEAAFLSGLSRNGAFKTWALTWSLAENPAEPVWGERAEKALAAWMMNYGRGLNPEEAQGLAGHYLSRGGLGIFSAELLTAKLAELAAAHRAKPGLSAFKAVFWSNLFSKLAFWRRKK